MSTHFEALVDLAPDGMEVYDTYADRRDSAGAVVPLTYPYIVLTVPGAFRENDLTIAGDSGVIAEDFRITIAGQTPAQVRYWAPIVRAAYDDATTTPTGWAGTVHHIRNEVPVSVDTDVTLTTFGHPAFCVDTYRYRAQTTA